MTCQICMFDHGPKGQAYKLSSDRKACIETCSWRREHNLCFPGVCNGYHTECQCDAGFTSTPGARDCLKTPKDDVTIDFHKSPNSVNYINTKPAPNRKIQLEWTATSRFKPTISSPGPREHFIPPSGYKIGLVRENFVFVLSGNQNFPDNSIGPLEETGISPSNPKLAERAFTGQLNQLPPAGWQLQSGHSLKYTYSVYNGGFVTVADLDARGATHPRFLTGESFTQAGTFVFDYSLPYHCTVAGHGARPCTQPFDQRMLELSEAFTKQNQINGKFGGWRDDHAGVLQYDIELKLMHKVGEVLKENEMAGSEHKIIDLNGEGEEERRNGGNREFSVHFDLPPDEPSVYTVVVTVRDAVRNSIKNVRRSRRFFIFDNSSSVESRDERYPLGVDDTVNNRGLWWLRRLDGDVAFRWTDNLINEVHTGQGFLLPIEHVPEFYGDGYDQTSGPRSIHPIDNVHGVVRFASQFGVDAVGGRSLQQPDQSRWLTTTDIHAQMQSFRFDRRDGESAKFWVIGEDVMGNSRVNSFLMHIDSSPAELGTLSLTNRGVEGLVVHHSRDLHSLRAHWTASDLHSGLHTVLWEIFDNHTDEIVQMYSNMEGRRHFDSLTLCQRDSERPDNCYCTQATGCYNSFFAASPNTNATTEHNHDLHIRLTVTNGAELVASSVMKISIDLSAPHPGHVFDGAPGDEEVDFQNGRHLTAHWSGFFDPESGVRMYRYGFGVSCQSESQLIQETTGLEASWEAPGPGRYFVTVVAFNNAMEPSAAVCSDGVLITDQRPEVSQLSIESLRVRPGLILDASSQELWYLTDLGRRQKLLNDNETCRARATVMADSGVLALDLSKFNRTVVLTHEGEFCEQIGPAGTEFYLTKDDRLKLSWIASDSVSGLRHSIVSVVSNEDSVSDLANRVVTTHSSEILDHIDLKDGQQIYLTIAAVNRAGLSSNMSVGPLTVDTSPPSFSGSLSVSTNNEHLLVRWDAGDFVDPESESLEFEIGVGSKEHSTDIVHFERVKQGPECSHSHTPVTCASLELSQLDWSLIGDHTYYVSIRCTNEAQLRTVAFAEPIVHNNRLPSVGFVTDEDPSIDSDSMLGTPHDIQYQLRSDSLRSRWTGFKFANEFHVSVVDSQHKELASVTLPSNATRHQFDGLKLDTYFTRVTASNVVGSVSADWITVEEFRRVSHSGETVLVTNLHLIDGATYRSRMKLCHGEVCSEVETAPDFVVLHTSPVAGAWSVNLEADNQTITVQMDEFKQLGSAGSSVISGYQWSLQHDGANIVQWTELKLDSSNSTKSISLPWPLKSTKCIRFAIRCFNKAGLSTVDSRELRDCSAYDPKLISNPNVMDAIGPVKLEKNDQWTADDVDYSNSSARLAAVWPQLRYLNYEWAVLAASGTGGSGYYDRILLEPPKRPTSHANAIAGGFTRDEFVNVPGVQLQPGTRYHVCIHANETLLQFEKFTQLLPELSECSDGVTVLGDVATEGRIAVNGRFANQMLSSVTEFLLEWSGFESGTSTDMPHVTDIKYYEYCIGSFASGCDLIDWKNVGGARSVIVTQLKGVLQEGHVYFVSVRAVDFIGRESRSKPRSVRVVLHGPKSNHSAAISVGLRHVISNSNGQEVCWNGRFSDPVAGIRRYWVGLGSSPGRPDVIPYTESDGECVWWTTKQLSYSRDGQHYWVLLRAENFAGLISSDHSKPVLVDRSPPVAGSVIDIDPTVSNSTDCNFRFNMDGISAKWTDFHDPHSHVRDYSVAIGSCPGCQDVMPYLHVGVRHSIKIDHLRLQPGQRYFVNVKGCNAGDLCSVASSDGVILDSTPPLNGIILIGSSDANQQYLRSSSSLEFSLYGFNDPESDIAYHRWGVGREESDSPDVIAWIKTFERKFVRHSGSLPTGIRLKVFVETVNKAGLTTLTESSKFLIDDTPPEIETALSASETFGQIEPNWLVLDDIMVVEWSVFDKESGIKEHWISLSNHDNGRVTFEPVKIPGLLSNFTFSDLDLKDGANYTVHLVSCNLADACTRQTASLAVDTSPPITGHVAAETESAVQLGRHIEDGLTWDGNEVNISWVGFHDPHSGIDRYTVQMGTTWFGSELLSVTEVPHSDEGVGLPLNPHEGPIQMASFELKRSLTEGTSLIVHIVAVNKAGLHSQPVQAALSVLESGHLWLLRRCAGAATCYGHCSCAPQHQTCRGTECRAVDVVDNVDNEVEVLDVSAFGPRGESQTDAKTTPTRSLLAATWRVRRAMGRPPVRYEVSAGLAEYSEPKGIYDAVHERVWHDVGLRTFLALNITAGRRLNVFRSYKVFVRAWFDHNTYVVFSSDGVLVNPTFPRVNRHYGVGVKDLLSPDSRRDTDFITSNDSLTVGWRNKFTSLNEAPPLSFRVSIGSEIGMDDVANVVIPPGNITYTFNGLQLEPGQRYFSTVTALDENGLSVSVSSDGFVLDLDNPSTGLVFNSIGHSNSKYSSDQTTLSCSWHSFFDRESYIKSYSACITSSNDASKCDIADWKNVKFEQRATWKGPWHHGSTYFCRAKAVDAANRSSEAITSPGVTIDTTPAIAANRIGHRPINVGNPSFEEGALRPPSSAPLSHIVLAGLESVSPRWTLQDGRAIAVRIGHSMAVDGESVLLLFGRVSQTLTTEAGRRYRMQLFASHLPVSDPLSVTVGGLVSGPGMLQTFRLFTDLGGVSSGVEWHKQIFYFTAESAESTVSIESLSPHTGLAIDMVSVSVLNVGIADYNSTAAPVHVDSVSVRDSGTVHASWDVSDPESGISEVLWAIGTVRGGTQLLPFTQLGPANEAKADVRLTHGSNVYVSVLAINGAGIPRLFHSQPDLIDLTPPAFDFVHDGSSSAGHTDLQENARELSVRFGVEDPESGLSECFWCSGTSAVTCDVAEYVKLAQGQLSATRLINEPEKLLGQRVFSLVRCSNGVGLVSTGVSAGVLIYNGAPDAAHAKLRLLSTSVTPFGQTNSVLGNATDLQLSWSGFTDRIPIRDYDIRLREVTRNAVVPDWTRVKGAFVQAAALHGLSLASGQRYRAEVRAVNALGKLSSIVEREFSVDSQFPALTGRQWQVSFDPAKRQLLLDWSGMFRSDSSLLFEVTVETKPAAGDLQRWLETREPSLLLKAIDPGKQRLFVRLSAISEAGLASSVYREVLV
uniref:EGF-like domain-containing protein n=1 Tax=Macrostomum lignano TaxID=282301 RepID=A0A1I8JEP6_9PLAT